jgi:hypothetical protein
MDTLPVLLALLSPPQHVRNATETATAMTAGVKTLGKNIFISLINRMEISSGMTRAHFIGSVFIS